jgi:recombination protein RecA
MASMQDKDKDKALSTVMSQIEKQHGKGAVMRLGDDVRPPIEVIPTGSIALDVALGIGGLPRGRVVEIYGPRVSRQDDGGPARGGQRAEGRRHRRLHRRRARLDPEYAKSLGVDIDNLLVSQPDTGEQALEIADMLIRSGALDIIVIDSVAALVPRAEIEGEMGDSHVGLQARLMSQALRKITGALNTTGTTAIFINQLREKIGVMFGSPETTTGGKALKFYASVRLDVRRIETLKDGTEAVGNRTRVKVVKNKVPRRSSRPSSTSSTGRASPVRAGLIDMGVEQGFVRKAGAWYTYDGDQLGQGKENARSSCGTTPTSPTSWRRRSRRSSVSARGSTSRPLPGPTPMSPATPSPIHSRSPRRSCCGSWPSARALALSSTAPCVGAGAIRRWPLGCSTG